MFLLGWPNSARKSMKISSAQTLLTWYRILCVAWCKPHLYMYFVCLILHLYLLLYFIYILLLYCICILLLYLSAVDRFTGVRGPVKAFSDLTDWTSSRSRQLFHSSSSPNNCQHLTPVISSNCSFPVQLFWRPVDLWALSELSDLTSSCLLDRLHTCHIKAFKFNRSIETCVNKSIEIGVNFKIEICVNCYP